MKILKQKSGFSLIEAMMAMGIMTVGITAMSHMLLTSAKAQNDLRISADIQSFFNRAQKIVDVQDTCTASLSGNIMSQPVVLRDPLVNATTIATEGTSFNDNWTVQTFRIENWVEYTGHPNVYRATLSIDASKNMARVIGVPVVHKTLQDIYVEVEPGVNVSQARITKCYGAADQVEIAKNNCQLLGGNWVPGNAFGLQCSFPGSASAVAALQNVSARGDGSH